MVLAFKPIEIWFKSHQQIHSASVAHSSKLGKCPQAFQNFLSISSTEYCFAFEIGSSSSSNRIVQCRTNFSTKQKQVHKSILRIKAQATAERKEERKSAKNACWWVFRIQYSQNVFFFCIFAIHRLPFYHDCKMY